MKIAEIVAQYEAAIQQLETGGAFEPERNYQPWLLVHNDEIKAYLESLLEQLRAAGAAGIEIHPVEWAIVGAEIVEALNSFARYTTEVLGNPANVRTLVGFCFSLRAALVKARVIDQAVVGSSLGAAVADTQARAIASARRIERDREKSVALLQDTKGSETSIRENATAAETLTKAIANWQTQSQNNVASIERVVAQVQDLSVQRDKLTNSIDEAQRLLGEKSTETQTLIDAATALKIETERRLEAATKVGLASAFSAREASSRNSFYGWSAALVVALGLLYWAAFALIHGLPEKQDAWSTVVYWLTHIPMTVPCVWFAWFASKQASYALRLSEDYAFKAASAMSLTAYKTEAADIDAALVKRLMEVAVTNFGENPLRVFESTTVAGSPLADFFKDKDVVAGLKDTVKALPDIAKKWRA